MDLEALLALIEQLDTLDDDALADLAENLTEAADALLDGSPSDDDIANAQRAVEAREQVEAEQQSRTDAAAERADRAQALRDRLHGEPEPEEQEGEPAEVVPADEVEVVEEVEQEPVAAAASRRTPARVGRVAARIPAPTTTPPVAPPLAFPEWGLVAAANAPGIAQGTPVTDYDQLSTIFSTAFRTITGPGLMGPRANVPLVRAGRGARGEYGEARTLDAHADLNAAKIRNVTHPQAITASGGMCVPIGVQYDLPTVGSTARPVRDTALARFGADRGGVRTLTAPVMADVTGAIGIWTNQNDIDAADTVTPGDNPSKPCLVLDCPSETESLVQAITQCVKAGNFRQRFFPEQLEAVMRLVAVAAARRAEEELLKGLNANSIAVTAARLLGTSRDVLAYLDQAMAAYRDRWRIDDGERLRWVAPRWLRDQMRADMARSLPGDPGVNFVIADTQIASWLGARNVNVTWTYDSYNAGGYFAAQAAGALVAWPTPVSTFLYPEGAFLFLDGGSLDIGLIRDSALVATNDLMMFSETFEGIHYMGPESLKISFTLCPDGTVSGTADIDPCV